MADGSFSAPAVLNESDVYLELAPPAWAREAIACFWVRRGDGRPVRVIPDGSTDIVWREGVGANVAGPDTGAWISKTAPGALIVGARFRAGAGQAVGVPLEELRDIRIPLDDLGLDLRGDLDQAAAPGAVARLALRLVAATPPDPAVQAAARLLRDPGRRVEGSRRPSASATGSCAAASSPPSATARRRSSGSCGCAASSIPRAPTISPAAPSRPAMPIRRTSPARCENDRSHPGRDRPTRDLAEDEEDDEDDREDGGRDHPGAAVGAETE